MLLLLTKVNMKFLLPAGNFVSTQHMCTCAVFVPQRWRRWKLPMMKNKMESETCKSIREWIEVIFNWQELSLPYWREHYIGTIRQVINWLSRDRVSVHKASTTDVKLDNINIRKRLMKSNQTEVPTFQFFFSLDSVLTASLLLWLVGK